MGSQNMLQTPHRTTILSINSRRAGQSLLDRTRNKSLALHHAGTKKLCPLEKRQHRPRCALERAPLAFNNLSIPGTSQFTMRFAVRCVLHRFSSQDIHRCKEYVSNSTVSTDLTNNLDMGNIPQESHRLRDSQTVEKTKMDLLLICANDPSAGSPTETLLRLLLPLSDKVYETS